MIRIELINQIKGYIVETKQFTSGVVDVLTLYLDKSQSIDLFYKRSKGFVFNEQILDYVVQYTKNYELLNDLKAINDFKK